MMNRIRHNSPSPIQCLRAFHILFFAYLLFRCYYYNQYKTQKYYFCYGYRYFHATLLLNILLQILSYPGVVELTTQLLILENILWLPLCRINKIGLNTLPSKTVAIPYTCGLSGSCSSSLHRALLHRLLFNQPSPRAPVQPPLHGATVHPALHHLLFILSSTGLSCSSCPPRGPVHPAPTGSNDRGL